MSEFWGGWGRTNSEWLWEPQCQWSNFTEAFRYSTLMTAEDKSCSFNVTAKAQNLRYFIIFIIVNNNIIIVNYSGKSWYRIYIWLECGYSIEVKMHDARRQKTKQKTFSLLCVMFITDPLLWHPCWPVCPHSAQYHHWPSCRPGRKEGRYALITFQHILNNGIAKKIYVSFYPTWNNTAVAYLCFVKAEKQVCADDSVLRKHKETSVSLPVSAVAMSASHGPVCPGTACQLAPCSHQPKQLPGGRAALYSCA